MRMLAPSWDIRGARLLSLFPGVIDTPMAARQFTGERAVAKGLGNTPLGWIGRPAEVVSVVEFLS